MSYERDKIIGLICRIFAAEEWKWANEEGVEEIPTYEQIKKHIDRLEEDTIKLKAGYLSCGRIVIEYDKENKTFNYLLEL